jgi:mannosyltransferase OCH1-like enzyme
MGHIPAILHHVWFGAKPRPPAYRAYIAGWRRLSSGWRMMGWTERDLDWSSRYVNEAYATRGWCSASSRGIARRAG